MSVAEPLPAAQPARRALRAGTAALALSLGLPARALAQTASEVAATVSTEVVANPYGLAALWAQGDWV